MNRPYSIVRMIAVVTSTAAIVLAGTKLGACDKNSVVTQVPLHPGLGGYQEITGCDFRCKGTCYVSQLPIDYCGPLGYEQTGGCESVTIIVPAKQGTCGPQRIGDNRACGCHDLSNTWTPRQVNSAMGC